MNKESAPRLLDKEDIPKLLGLLDTKRCEEFADWIKVGLCLYNIESTDAQLKLWKRWTQKAEKFKAAECDKHWAKFTKKEEGGLTMGSLIFWAKEDNEEEYTKYRKEKEMKKFKDQKKQKKYKDV